MTVIDASALLVALAVPGGPGRAARRRLSGAALTAPALIDLEVAAALRRLVAGGRMARPDAESVLADCAVLPIERVSHERLVPRCWELRDNLTVYDASYVALAELLGTTLVTADGRLARAPGLRCPVDLLGAS